MFFIPTLGRNTVTIRANIEWCEEVEEYGGIV